MKNLIKKYLLWELKILARYLIKRDKPKIVAITGSIGKTSTKEAIYTLLSKKFPSRVAATPGNLNSEYGLPLAILGFKKQPWLFGWLWVLAVSWFKIFFVKLPQYLILEMAADKPGDIDYLTGIVKPDIAVITSIGPTHLEQFKTIENVAREKIKLVEALPENGIAVLNEDDPYLKERLGSIKNKKIVFSAKPLEIATRGAIAVGRAFNILTHEAEEILKFFEMPEGRLNVLPGIFGSTLINDSYNANPLSMKAALEKLSAMSGERKIAFLGDMLELGPESQKFHFEIANFARKNSDLFVAVGPQFKQTNPERWFATAEEATAWLLKEIKENDIILIKASHDTGLYKIVDDLRK